MNIAGMEVLQSNMATQPKLWTLRVFQLRPWITVGDQFRAEMDAWLRETFGDATEVVEYGREPGAYVIDLDATGPGVGKRLIVHPALYQKMKSIVTERSS